MSRIPKGPISLRLRFPSREEAQKCHDDLAHCAIGRVMHCGPFGGMNFVLVSSEIEIESPSLVITGAAKDDCPIPLRVDEAGEPLTYFTMAPLGQAECLDGSVWDRLG